MRILRARGARSALGVYPDDAGRGVPVRILDSGEVQWTSATGDVATGPNHGVLGFKFLAAC